jgi:hypothetical protein
MFSFHSSKLTEMWYQWWLINEIQLDKLVLLNNLFIYLRVYYIRKTYKHIHTAHPTSRWRGFCKQFHNKYNAIKRKFSAHFAVEHNKTVATLSGERWEIKWPNQPDRQAKHNYSCFSLHEKSNSCDNASIKNTGNLKPSYSIPTRTIKPHAKSHFQLKCLLTNIKDLSFPEILELS